MVGVQAGCFLSPTLDARDVKRDVDVEPREERREGTVQVVAVAPAPGEDALHGGERSDARRPAADDVDGLVGHPCDMCRLQGAQCVGVDGARESVEPEQVEIGPRDVVGQALRGVTRGGEERRGRPTATQAEGLRRRVCRSRRGRPTCPQGGGMAPLESR